MTALLIIGAFLTGSGSMVMAARRGVPPVGATLIGVVAGYGLIAALWLAGWI